MCVWVSVGVWVGVWVGVCGWVSRCGVWGVASMCSNTRWNCGGWIGECHVYYTVVGVYIQALSLPSLIPRPRGSMETGLVSIILACMNSSVKLP